MITLKKLIDEDFVNYKKCSMLLAFPSCQWKCEECHNRALADAPDIKIDPQKLVARYLANPISEAIIFAGLEPFDSIEDLINSIREFRKHTEDIIIVYTGYTEREASMWTPLLRAWSNIIIKFGRYDPTQSEIYDPVLGVTLSSSNQYARYFL